MFSTKRKIDSKWTGLEALPAREMHAQQVHEVKKPIRIVHTRPKTVESASLFEEKSNEQQLAATRQKVKSFLSVQMQAGDRRHISTQLPKVKSRLNTKPKALLDIEAHIDAELRLLTTVDPKETHYHRLNIFRQVFQMLSGVTKVYGPLMESVISEYEGFITFLEEKAQHSGGDKKEIYRQFEDEVLRQKTQMKQEITRQGDALERQKQQLSQREREIHLELDRLLAENDRLQLDIARLHDQNLTLSSNVVDLRYQNQTIERELKEAEQLGRKYRKLHTEHQALLETVSSATALQPSPENPPLADTPKPKPP